MDILRRLVFSGWVFGLAFAGPGLAMKDESPEIIFPLLLGPEALAEPEIPAQMAMPSALSFSNLKLRVEIVERHHNCDVKFFDTEGKPLGHLTFDSPVISIVENEDMLEICMKSPKYSERIKVVILRNYRRVNARGQELISSIASEIWRKRVMGNKEIVAKLFDIDRRAFDELPADIKEKISSYVVWKQNDTKRIRRINGT